MLLLLIVALLVRRRRLSKGRAAGLSSDGGGLMYANPAYQGNNAAFGTPALSNDDTEGQKAAAAPPYLEPNRNLNAGGGVVSAPHYYTKPRVLPQDAGYDTPLPGNNADGSYIEPTVAWGTPTYTEPAPASASHNYSHTGSPASAYVQPLSRDYGYQTPVYNAVAAYAQLGAKAGTAAEDIYQVPTGGHGRSEARGLARSGRHETMLVGVGVQPCPSATPLSTMKRCAG